MINPGSYEGAVSSIRFMCGVDADKKRQYTFAEVNVTWKTTSPFQMSFFLQDDSDFADESCLVDLMGGTPVSQGMVCWN